MQFALRQSSPEDLGSGGERPVGAEDVLEVYGGMEREGERERERERERVREDCDAGFGGSTDGLRRPLISSGKNVDFFRSLVY